MKIYLEFNEILSKQELLAEQPQQIRLEVSSRDEAIKKFEALKSLIPLPEHYEARIHYCGHDEGKPCRFETIEKR